MIRKATKETILEMTRNIKSMSADILRCLTKIVIYIIRIILYKVVAIPYDTKFWREKFWQIATDLTKFSYPNYTLLKAEVFGVIRS